MPTSASAHVTRADDIEAAALVDQWFESRAQNDDLSQLDDILRGEEGVHSQTQRSIAAEWERTHQWLTRGAAMRSADGTAEDGAPMPAFPYYAIDHAGNELPRATVSLAEVAGHDLKVFRGLQP